MEENGTYRWSPPREKKTPDWKKIKRVATLVIVILAALALVSTCYYTVDDKQQAVVTTFGKVTDITDAGVHLKLPFGIQRVEKVDVNVYQKITLGYDPVGTSGYVVDDRDSAMITGDYNIVNVDFFVEYKVSDPVQYLYSSNDPEGVLYRGFRADQRQGEHPDAGEKPGFRNSRPIRHWPGPGGCKDPGCGTAYPGGH